MRRGLGDAIGTLDKWGGRLADVCGEDAVCLILVPKPDRKTGLHRVILGTNGGSPTRVYIEELRNPEDPQVLADAYRDRADRREIGDFAYYRSHSPNAGLDRGPRAGKGYGYTLYATNALNATMMADAQHNIAGVFSPEGGASESAEAMWENLVRLGAAEEDGEGDEDVEIEDFCHPISDRYRDVDYGDRGAYVNSTKVCGTVEASVRSERARYLTAWNVLSSDWLLDWTGAMDWYRRIVDKYGSAGRRFERYTTWTPDREVLVRADPGPDATFDQIMFIANRILALSDHATRREFLQRPDIFARLPVHMQNDYHPDQARMSFMSGVGRHSAARLGTTQPAQLRPKPLPAPSARYKAAVAKWSDIDF